jgi:hypothetical protein
MKKNKKKNNRKRVKLRQKIIFPHSRKLRNRQNNNEIKVNSNGKKRERERETIGYNKGIEKVNRRQRYALLLVCYLWPCYFVVFAQSCAECAHAATEHRAHFLNFTFYRSTEKNYKIFPF